jgi:peptidoglycan/LPS O-acetylase OafA/YrhL
LSAVIQVAKPNTQLISFPDSGREATYSRSISSHIPTLDGWRALAILGVVAYHSLAQGFPGRIFYGVAVRGYAGVNVFFALSGFLICGKLLREQQLTSRISLKRFYLARSFRILPALGMYLAVLAALGAAGWVKSQGWEFESTLLFVRNYFPMFDGQHPIGVYTAQFWSLAVEEHFYLVWPVVMLLLGPSVRRVGLAALGLAVAVCIWRTVDAHYGWFVPFATSVDGKTDTRLDALLWGCLAAIVYPYVQPRIRALPFCKNLWMPIAAILAVVLILKQVPGGNLIQAILFPVLIMSTAIVPDSTLGRILELRLLKWTGRLSYSIYLWQQLLLIPVDSSKSPLRAFQHFPSNIAFVFLIAACSYYFVEKPMIEMGRRLEHWLQMLEGPARPAVTKSENIGLIVH